MILSRGITGFADYRSGAPECIEPAYFKKACYLFKQSGMLAADICCHVNTSFYYAKIHDGGEQFYVLMNKYVPRFAFSASIECGQMKFIDIANEPLTRFGYNVIPAEKLNEPFDFSDHEFSPCKNLQSEAKYAII
ncbi:MAG: hypothetical protein IIZ59_03380 [Clostridia bacterium]|nr:hypothetical protein [Clostridia bacterium]